MDTDKIFEILSVYIRAGFTPEVAFKKVCEIYPEDQVRVELKKFSDLTGRFRFLNETTTLKSKEVDSYLWYLGPQPEDRYWPALKNYLQQEKRWKPEAIESLDKSSSKVISLLQPPGLTRISTRGLVVGYVQSGKTANYSAVITKAADVGYKLFIVLSGLTDKLRNQTQGRLAQEITDLGLTNQENWVKLTSEASDFRLGFVGNANVFLTRNNQHKVLGVVKKNAAILRRLRDWLKSAHSQVLHNCPVLIIDDEADQASVNASKTEEKRTAINRLIMEILSLLPKAAYVGYTATPFANVFIDPTYEKDLYPRDFIIDLPRPTGYFGAEQIFGRDKLSQDEEDPQSEGLDMIRSIEEEEIPFLKPASKNERFDFIPEMTPSLESAIRYFWLATAARAVRGDHDKHSTMLIHTTLYTDVHDRFLPLLEKYQEQIQAQIDNNEDSLLEELRAQWEEEQRHVPSADVKLSPVSFDSLFPYLHKIISETKILAENSRSIEKLEYGEDPKIQIVVGGNILARGLTLEGLIVSFFLRTANAYDTLLQMGRWFGYRPRYEDLPRIWMTEELERYFYDMATVEQEIRNDIKRFEIENLTPLEFAVRVQTHPALEITSRLKMAAAIPCDVSYSGKFPQTILFNHTDKDWLTKNLTATRSLVKDILARGIQPVSRGQNFLFKEIPSNLILSFLSRYAFHEENRALTSKLLTGYIKAQNKQGELDTWDVVVVSRKNEDPSDPNKVIDLGLPESVPLLNRSRLVIDPTIPYANLGVIVNGYTDVVADLDLPKEELKELTTLPGLQAKRPKGVGLLLLYPISKDSVPMKGEKMIKRGKRKNLEAAEHLIGVAIAFPEASKPTVQKYMSVDLSKVAREEEELSLEDEENDLVSQA